MNISDTGSSSLIPLLLQNTPANEQNQPAPSANIGTTPATKQAPTTDSGSSASHDSVAISPEAQLLQQVLATINTTDPLLAALTNDQSSDTANALDSVLGVDQMSTQSPLAALEQEAQLAQTTTAQNANAIARNQAQ